MCPFVSLLHLFLLFCATMLIVLISFATGTVEIFTGVTDVETNLTIVGYGNEAGLLRIKLIYHVIDRFFIHGVA